MKYEECPDCGGPAVRVAQTGDLSCAKQCKATTPQRTELQELTARMAALLEQHAPRTGPIGFSLIMFDFGTGENIAYASTAKRESMKSPLRKLLERWEAETKP